MNTPGMHGLLIYAPKRLAADAQRALGTPGISGMTIMLKWADVETSQGVYDWAFLDAMLAGAAQYGYDVQLALASGASTPEWLYALGVPKLHFTRAPELIPPCVDVYVPPPWDTTYLEHFGNWIDAVSRHVAGNTLIKQVRLTGINVVSEELHMQSQRAHPQVPCLTDSLKVWNTAGYRRELVVAAWHVLLSTFDQAFPGMYFCLSIIPTGMPEHSLVKQLVKMATQAFPGRLTLQFDSLLPFDRPGNAETAQIADELGLPLAWQSNLWASQRAACGGTRKIDPVPCNEDSFTLLIAQGFTYGGDVRSSELFPADVVDFPRAIRDGATMFAQRAGQGVETMSGSSRPGLGAPVPSPPSPPAPVPCPPPPSVGVAVTGGVVAGIVLYNVLSWGIHKVLDHGWSRVRAHP